MLSVFECAPLVYIAKKIVSLVVLQQEEWAVYLDAEPNDHSIHFSSDVLYTLFGQIFDITSTSSSQDYITSKTDSMHADRRPDVFGACFNLPLIFKITQTKKLLMTFRMSFVDRYIIRILDVRQHESEAAFTEADIGEKDSQMHEGSKASQTSTRIIKIFIFYKYTNSFILPF